MSSSRIRCDSLVRTKIFHRGSDVYPHFIKVAVALTLCSLAGLAIDVAPALSAGDVASYPAAASGEPGRPASNPERAGRGQTERENVTPASAAPPGLARLEDLRLLSEALVERAGSGSTPAHAFRIDARMYREMLRQTMLSDRSRPAEAQLPQPLLLDMVRMSALLHAAADCKTGAVIVCPADLLQQLRSQQSRVTQGLDMYRMMYE